MDFSESDFDSDESDDCENQSQVYTCSRKKMDQINDKLIKFILNNNLSFNLVESEDFQSFIDSVRKNFYKLPCRQSVRNTLLFGMVTKF